LAAGQEKPSEEGAVHFVEEEERGDRERPFQIIPMQRKCSTQSGQKRKRAKAFFEKKN